jgi:hypothetical protein
MEFDDAYLSSTTTIWNRSDGEKFGQAAAVKNEESGSKDSTENRPPTISIQCLFYSAINQ